MSRKLFQWKPHYFTVVFLQVLLINELVFMTSAKRGGGGGMGRSGGRAPSGGSMGRGGIGNAGRSNPTYNRGGTSNVGAGAAAAGSYAGSKPKSSWKKTALAGVAGAVVGAAISHQLTKSHYSYPYGGRNYYYGDRYYRPAYHYSKKCSYSLPPNEYLNYTDGYRVTDIVFDCDGRTEYCCGMECCRNGLPWWAILLVIVAIAGLVSCCIFAIMKARRRSQSNIRYSGGSTEASVPLQASTADYPGGAKGYPGTAPAGGYYPPAATYAAGGWQGQPTSSYPTQPYSAYPPPAPAYGFNVQPQPGMYRSGY